MPPQANNVDATTGSALLDALGVEEAFVVGASGGAPASVEFAQRHADRTLGLVVLVGLLEAHAQRGLLAGYSGLG